MKEEKKALIQLHISILLAGFTAILGDLISLSAVSLVWWRVVIAVATLGPIVYFRKTLAKMSRKKILQFVAIGFLVGLHWFTFYGSIKMANASIALVALSTASFITSVMEPIIIGRPVRKIELLVGLLIIPGIILIVYDLQFSQLAGLFVGILSAFLASIFSIFNNKLLAENEPADVTFLEMVGVLIIASITIGGISIFGKGLVMAPTFSDIIYLLILGIICTTILYLLYIYSVRHVSAFSINLSYNMEPVYGIILAAILLNDTNELSPKFYFGAFIIFLIVFMYPYLIKKYSLK